MRTGQRATCEVCLPQTARRDCRWPARRGLPNPPAPDVIDHLLCQRVEEHAVHGEVAAESVFARRAEGHGVRMPAVAVGRVTPKRRHLNLSFLPAAQDGDDAERRADGQRMPLAETAADFVGRGVGGHIVVVRDASRATHPAHNRPPTGPRNPAARSFCTIQRAKCRAAVRSDFVVHRTTARVARQVTTRGHRTRPGASLRQYHARAIAAWRQGGPASLCSSE